jgi:DNA-binding GntR family transcriptional regulator
MKRTSRPADIVGSSLVEALVKHLREQILTGKIAPGEKIVVRKIQEEFDISHIPVREALGRLEAEDLVVKVPRRGALAAPVSVKELIDIYDLRRIIEPEVAVRSARIADEGHFETIRVALASTDSASKAPTSERFVAANRRFHEAIFTPTANPTIMRTLSHLWRMSDRYLRLGMAIPDSVEVTCQQHHDIFAALCSRDEDAIRTTVSVHLTLADAAIRSLERVYLDSASGRV